MIMSRQILVEQLNVRKVVVGYDHRFGRNRTASLEDMYHYADIHEFEVIEINAEKIESTAVSSTKIRKAIDEGNIELANTYLGHSFTIEGMVIDGDKRGRELSYPTANIDLQNQHKIVLARRLSSQIEIERPCGLWHDEYRNKPTFDTTMPSIEVHFLDWNGNLYGQAVQVELLKWVREEKI